MGIVVVTTTACALQYLLGASTLVAVVDTSLEILANVTATANARTIAVKTTGPSAREALVPLRPLIRL